MVRAGAATATATDVSRHSEFAWRVAGPVGTPPHAVENLREEFDPELPERPDPEIDEVNEDHWLFDSQRDYLTQLKHDKDRKAVSTDDAA